MNLAATIATRIVTDVLAFCVLFAVAGVLQNKPPHQMGYFPDDLSIQLPYKESTVPSAVLYGVSIALIVLTVLIGELVKYRNQLNEKICVFPVVVCALYEVLTATFFGYMATIAIADIGKVVLGRLRPNFFSVCNPTAEHTTQYDYVYNYTCNPAKGADLSAVWKSFPSGHSATAMFSAVFICLYLQWSFPRIPYLPTVRPLIQTIILALGLGVCYSRVVDNKHHRTDVLAGGLLGMFVAFSVPFYLTRSAQEDEELVDAHKIAERSNAEMQP